MARHSNACALALLVLGFLAAGSQAQTYTSVLEGSNQYPDPLTDEEVNGATAAFDVTLNGDDASWTLAITDIVNLTMAHIHIGNATTNGPVLVILVPVGGAPTEDGGLPVLEEPFSGTTTFTGNFTPADFIAGAWTWDEFTAAADAEGLYANLHTVEYPAGAIRGQLIEVAVGPAPEEPLTPIEPEAPEPTPAPSAGLAASLGKAATLVAALLGAALF